MGSFPSSKVDHHMLYKSYIYIYLVISNIIYIYIYIYIIDTVSHDIIIIIKHPNFCGSIKHTEFVSSPSLRSFFDSERESFAKEYSVLHGLERLEDVSQTITKGVYAISLEDAKARFRMKRRFETSGGLGSPGSPGGTPVFCAEMG